VYLLSAARPPISGHVSVVPHFHALSFGPSFSGPAFSVISSFLVPHFQVLHFQSTHRASAAFLCTHGHTQVLGPSATKPPIDPGWRRGVVVSGVRHINEVNARRARLVLGWQNVQAYLRPPPTGAPQKITTTAVNRRLC